MGNPKHSQRDERNHPSTIIETTLETEATSPEQERSAGNDERMDAAQNRRRNEPITVLIVDDHALMREGLHQLLTLEGDMQVVGEAADGFEALEKIRQVHPQVVLMDIHLPVVDGIAVTRQITSQFPDIAVIMLTMHRQQQQIVDAMKSGARGYLLKSSTVHDLAQSIRAVQQGEMAIAPALTGAIVNELKRQHESPGSPQTAQLSEKEVEIIRYLAAGMSNKEIAEHLAYSEKTVKNYLSIIFQKLHLRDRTQVAIFALRQGLLPDEEL
ncbi:response regulator [Tengunoibacter tsumagoiensis]|uniref:DNA-binding response regulator n=1 Tax=Tengunoibacter tsumagoiensis TaxID=2014871 RepID=A0A401ZUT0_9CHLR|nr:response regulator transcription factor [Tengunoibacter tsumagoiensis]GCE10546.1 DNA-binding response regulator [Tengunoibacter tsumagoiensis]